MIKFESQRLSFNLIVIFWMVFLKSHFFLFFRVEMVEKKSTIKSTKNGDSTRNNSVKRTNSKKKIKSPSKSASKKKSTVSFDISPRVERVPNPKKTDKDIPVENLSFNESRTSYVPFDEENSLPELSQAVIHKKMSKMLHLLDTRPMNYVCVTDRRNR